MCNHVLSNAHTDLDPFAIDYISLCTFFFLLEMTFSRFPINSRFTDIIVKACLRINVMLPRSNSATELLRIIPKTFRRYVDKQNAYPIAI